MIVELSRDHLAYLIAEEPVTIGDVTVRVGDGGVLERDVRQERADARAAVTGEQQFWMRARFDGKCPSAGELDCTGKIKRGDRVLRDRAGGKTYCFACGHGAYPNVVDPRA